MAKNRIFLVLDIILLVAVGVSLAGGGGGSRAPSQATSRATASQRLDTGPPGLPLYCAGFLTHDQQGNIYVTDSDQGQQNSHRARIVKLSPTGQLLNEWHVFTTFHGFPGGPWGIAVDASGTIYVADAGDNTIKKLSPIGKVLAIWKQPMDVPPFGITVDTQGNIYVAVKSIKKLSSSGAVLATWRATCP